MNSKMCRLGSAANQDRLRVGWVKSKDGVVKQGGTEAMHVLVLILSNQSITTKRTILSVV